ncbi:MAG: regulatory protein RecX [Phycisphaerales bacterium]
MAKLMQIERIELKPDGAAAAIIAGGSVVAMLDAVMVARSVVRIGEPWDHEAAARVAHANLVAVAIARMIKLLAASPKSEADLRARLESAGHEPRVVADAIAALRERGLINDDALATGLREKLREKGQSARVISERLDLRGLSAEGLTPEEEREAAEETARRAAAKLPRSVSPEVRWRRVLAALARRGFEEDLAREAAGAVLGPEPDRVQEE